MFSMPNSSWTHNVTTPLREGCMADFRKKGGFGFPSRLRHLARIFVLFTFALPVLLGLNSWAGVGGSVSGTVKDASGAVVPKAFISATILETGVEVRTITNGQGFYSFTNL